MSAWFFAPWVVHAAVLALHLVLPARTVDGYVPNAVTGRPLRYRLNGWLVLLVSVALWAGACRAGWLAWDALWTHRWIGLAGAAVLGLLFTLAIVLFAPPTGRGLLADLFFGRLENPQGLGGRVDAKMYLYLTGAVLLELNVLSFAAHHLLAHPQAPSPGVLLSAALLTWFVCDYLVFERVHLYTYDIFAERVGFKLGWGCLTFYPYFYAIGLGTTAHLPNPGIPTWALVACAAVFFAGWTLARGANLQKYAFKRDPERPFLGFIRPTTVTDGERALLCSGFWGIARHVNYLGEVLMAAGITLALGWPTVIWPWLYPVYYVLLLGTRERDDDRRCAEKYGELWAEYRRRVPRRIIPGLYVFALLSSPGAAQAYMPEREPIEPSTWGIEPPSYFEVGIAFERGDDNFVGRDLWGDQLLGASVMYRVDDVAVGGRLLASPKFERSSFLELRLLLGLDLRYHHHLGIEWSVGAGASGEARLKDHFWLLYATLFELGAMVYESGTFEVRLFGGIRYLITGALVNSFLIDPNGFDNENAADALQGERDAPLEGFFRIVLSRRVE